MGIALCCHLVGDVLIETAPLPLAMAAFLAGHVVYLSLFLRWRQPWQRLGGGRRALGALLTADAVLLGALVIPRAGELAPAVSVYALALLAMALAATGAAAPWPLRAGATLYVLSDSLLAYDLFVAPLPAAELLTWPTYWLGQALLLVGALGHVGAAGQGLPPAHAAAAAPGG
jgi:uncharacterized membrane protein YhhN